MGQGTRKGTGTTSGVTVPPWPRPRPGLVAAMGVGSAHAPGQNSHCFVFCRAKTSCSRGVILINFPMDESVM